MCYSVLLFFPLAFASFSLIMKKKNPIGKVHKISAKAEFIPVNLIDHRCVRLSKRHPIRSNIVLRYEMEAIKRFFLIFLISY